MNKITYKNRNYNAAVRHYVDGNGAQFSTELIKIGRNFVMLRTGMDQFGNKIWVLAPK